MSIKNYRAKLIHKQQLSEKVYRFRFSAPGSEFDFAPGQFMSIEVADKVRRSYSLSNNPDQTDYMETIVDISPGGPGSQFFVNSQIGDEVAIMAPLGRFVYQIGETRPAHFYATGTGLAPLMSMIKYALVTERTERPLQLLFGVRYEADLFLVDELELLAAEHSNFSCRIFVSRPSNEWQGERGYVNQYINEQDLLTEDIDAYICGGTGMVQSTAELLEQVGVPSEQVHFEKFY